MSVFHLGAMYCFSINVKFSFCVKTVFFDHLNEELECVCAWSVSDQIIHISPRASEGVTFPDQGASGCHGPYSREVRYLFKDQINLVRVSRVKSIQPMLTNVLSPSYGCICVSAPERGGLGGGLERAAILPSHCTYATYITVDSFHAVHSHPPRHGSPERITLNPRYFK